MKVLVTGATGFVGRSVVERLARGGWTVVAGGRSGWAGAPLERVYPVALDVTDCQAIREAMLGCSVTVHLAGLAHTHGLTEQEYMQVNTEGTRNVAREAGRAGVRRFVFMSTAKVHGPSTDKPFTEQDEPSPPSPYARSKLLGEVAAAEVASQSGMHLTVLRPPLIYGPGVKANLLAMLKALAKGWPIPVSRTNRRSILGLSNAASAVAHCVSPSGPTGTFLVSDGTDLSTYQMADALCVGLGRGCRALVVPQSTARLIRLAHAPTFDRLLASFALDISRLLATGWAPSKSASEGLAETGRWYTSVGRGS